MYDQAQNSDGILSVREALVFDVEQLFKVSGMGPEPRARCMTHNNFLERRPILTVCNVTVTNTRESSMRFCA
jgi:hypothetical protein